MSSSRSTSRATAKLGEDVPQGNLPSQPYGILYIKVRLRRLEPQYVQIPVESFLSETPDKGDIYVGDHDAKVIVRTAINEAVMEMLDADESGVYDDDTKKSIEQYLGMLVQGTEHLKGLYYEIRSKSKPLQVTVGYHRVARTLVSRATSETVFTFDIAKAISHRKDRDIFEMYRGLFKDDETNSLFTSRQPFGGSPSILTTAESIMMHDDNDPKGTRVLSPHERKLDMAAGMHDDESSKMPKNIDVVVEDVDEDKSSSGGSDASTLPPIKEPVNRRRFGSLFPNAVAQAIADAADGITSAFSKGPPPAKFAKGPPSDLGTNFGKKIRDMHSPDDHHTPTDSRNFAVRRDYHARKENNRASFHVPGHDSMNYDTPDYNDKSGAAVPMFTNQSSGNFGAQGSTNVGHRNDSGRGANHNTSHRATQSRPAVAPTGVNPSGPSRRCRTSNNPVQGNVSSGMPRSTTVPFSGIRRGAVVSYPQQLYCEDGESENTRWANLVKLADKDIPQTRHRNGTTLKDSDKFDTELPCMSVRRFINRCAMNGIYVPPLSAFTEESCMGREYECDVLPTKIYEDIPLMRRSGKKDLLHVTQKDATLASIVSCSPDLYVGLHNILRLQVHACLSR